MTDIHFEDMADLPEFKWADKKGHFIGSTGMIFVDQTAADIYFSNYWRTAGDNQRLAVVCTSWGISMLYLQDGTRDDPSTHWQPNQLLHAAVNVHDHGIQPPNGQQMVPLAVQAVQAGSPGMHIINEMFIGGLRLPWHRRVVVTRAGNRPMHYHQHEERDKHEEHVVPAIKAGGTHSTFDTLVYGSQVSSFRRVQKLHRHPNEDDN